MKKIATIYTDFPDKFGIPRQSGLIDELVGKIVFEKEYRDDSALKGLEQFSHIWLIWEFSEAKREDWSPTVRPPRLGGNTRMGVFATRSPFRPNPVGLSAVKIKDIVKTKTEGTVIFVTGADLMNGTPIYDIKPYIPLSDCIPDALEGYTRDTKVHFLNVDFPEELLCKIREEKRISLIKVLEQDPRPSYIDDSERIYGVSFSGYNVRFRVAGDTLYVTEVDNI